jgi:hypothetical protein
MSQGFQGITGFNPAVLYFITIHRYRGLFYHSPLLVPAIWGWVVMWRTAGRRSDAILSISMIVGYLIFNSSYYMWWGGWTNGPRHLIPALPFLIIPLWWVWRSHWIGKATIILLAIPSVFWNTLPAMVDAQIRQGYQAFQLYNPTLTMNYQDPLWHFGIKQFLLGNLAMNGGNLLGLRGLWSLVPLGGLLSALGVAMIPFLRATKNGDR